MGDLLNIVSQTNHGVNYKSTLPLLEFAKNHNITIVSPSKNQRQDACIKEGYTQIGSRETFQGFDFDDRGELIIKTRLMERHLPNSFFAKDKNIIGMMIHENKIYGVIEELTNSKFYKITSCRNGYPID